MSGDAACLVAEVHGRLVRLVASATGQHFQGLRAASSSLRRNGLITNRLARQLTRLDDAFAVIRHITSVRSDQIADELAASIQQAVTRASQASPIAASMSKREQAVVDKSELVSKIESGNSDQAVVTIPMDCSTLPHPPISASSTFASSFSILASASCRASQASPIAASMSKSPEQKQAVVDKSELVSKIESGNSDQAVVAIPMDCSTMLPPSISASSTLASSFSISASASSGQVARLTKQFEGSFYPTSSRPSLKPVKKSVSPSASERPASERPQPNSTGRLRMRAPRSGWRTVPVLSDCDRLAAQQLFVSSFDCLRAVEQARSDPQDTQLAQELKRLEQQVSGGRLARLAAVFDELLASDEVVFPDSSSEGEILS